MRKIEAVQKMVNQEFNAIPLTLIEKAYPYIDGWEHVTPIKVGDYVIYDGEGIEVTGVNVDGDSENIHISNDGIINEVVNVWEVDKEDPAIFPMWGTVWQAVGFQNDWIADNLDMVAACGFEIYEADDVDGYILGVNGAGYDFYEAHWIPLYEAQELQWHIEVDE